ncbi:MAG: hypothetical protein ACJ8BW_18605 [Ktedonobacteraceae bacterium]
MEQRVPFVRVLKLSRLLETFFIASVTSILVIRTFLASTGYPQLGGHGLHIAHMLWGGLLMLIALVLLLAFIGRHMQSRAALLGGIGFGTFIDELGKFITSDNNYFFQPAIPLIYIIFVLLFLSFRELENHPSSSERTRLANALHILAEDAPRGLPEEDKYEVLWLLRADDSHDARLPLLADAVEQMPVVPPSKPGVLDRIMRSMRNLYVRIVHSPYFAGIIISCFIAYALLFTVVMVFGMVHVGQLVASKVTRDVVQIGLFVSSVVSSILIVVGALFLRKSPLQAYLWFKRAILVSIFLTQVFLFYTQQLVALGALAVNLLVLGALNALIRTHQQEARHAVLERTTVS